MIVALAASINHILYKKQLFVNNIAYVCLPDAAFDIFTLMSPLANFIHKLISLKETHSATVWRFIQVHVHKVIMFTIFICFAIYEVSWIHFKRRCEVIIYASLVPVEGKSSVCAISVKHRKMVLIIVIISLGKILSYIANTSRTHTHTHTLAQSPHQPTMTAFLVIALRWVGAPNHVEVNDPFSPSLNGR